MDEQPLEAAGLANAISDANAAEYMDLKLKDPALDEKLRRIFALALEGPPLRSRPATVDPSMVAFQIAHGWFRMSYPSAGEAMVSFADVSQLNSVVCDWAATVKEHLSRLGEPY